MVSTQHSAKRLFSEKWGARYTHLCAFYLGSQLAVRSVFCKKSIEAINSGLVTINTLRWYPARRERTSDVLFSLFLVAVCSVALIFNEWCCNISISVVRDLSNWINLETGDSYSAKPKVSREKRARRNKTMAILPNLIHTLWPAGDVGHFSLDALV